MRNSAGQLNFDLLTGGEPITLAESANQECVCIIQVAGGDLKQGPLVGTDDTERPIILTENGTRYRGDYITEPTAYRGHPWDFWTVGFPDGLLIRHVAANSAEEAIKWARFTPEYREARRAAAGELATKVHPLKEA